MRPRSITGPLILVLIGGVFLINNIRPDLLTLSRIGEYWPFLVIAAGVIGLIEVLFHAGRGIAAPPRPFYGVGIFWILVAGLIVASISRGHRIGVFRFDAPGVAMFGSDYDYDVNVTESSRGVTRIVFDNVHGDLSVKGEDTGDVKITGRKTVRALNHGDAEAANERSQVRVEHQGDLLLIHTDETQGSRPLQITTNLDITVPRGISVEARGRNGDISVDGIEGGVDLSAGRGDVRLNHIGMDVHMQASRSGAIRVADVKGGVEVQGRGSDVQIENVQGPVTVNGEFGGTLEFRDLPKPMHFVSSRTEFRVESVPGSITMDLSDLRLNDVAGVYFRTGTRDVQANDVTGALDIELNRGDIQINVTKTPVPKVDAHTHVGNVIVSLPDHADFQLQGSTQQGDASNEYGGGSQNSTGRSATVTAGTGNGPTIMLNTTRGDISIKKS